MQSYIEISESKLLNNYYLFKKYLKNETKIICVLKGNAYGRGIKEVVKILDKHADYFMVDDVIELKTLRKYSNKPVLVIGYLDSRDLKIAIALGSDVSAHNEEHLSNINNIAKSLNKKPRVHIEIDAEFGRMGVLINDLTNLLVKSKEMKNVDIYAIYAHFSCATEQEHNVHDKRQLQIFNKAISLCKQYGFLKIKTHISSTAGLLVHKESYDFVRIGAGLYGILPSEDIKKISKVKGLKPIFRWVSHIAQTKVLPANYPIGYGGTFITTKPTKIAVIPQGYGDGYDCRLSNKGSLLVRGQRCEILGRISMNMMVIDVTKIKDINVGEEVVIIGNQEEEEITIEEFATYIGTMHAEASSKISAILPRRIVQ